MKTILLVVFLFFPVIGFASSFEGYEANKARLQPKIEQYAEKYGVSVEVMNHIVDKESSYRASVIGDMHITCKRTGLPVRARGLVQITECWFAEVTDEQAFDEDFALEFLAKHLSKGYCRWWSTCPIALAKI